MIRLLLVSFAFCKKGPKLLSKRNVFPDSLFENAFTVPRYNETAKAVSIDLS